MYLTTNSIEHAVTYLKGKRTLVISTSNRWDGAGEEAKSTQLAKRFAESLDNAVFIDASKLNIYTCEGNVSTQGGNTCGLKGALLKDDNKNPSGCHRCWASINNPDDELWKISRELLNSDAVIFFVSTRWGSANSVYQRLIERLNWLENRWTTLGEDNIISNIEAGIVAIGHNWNVRGVIELQKQVYQYYGFSVPPQLSLAYQWTTDSTDETNAGYKRDSVEFEEYLEATPSKLSESFSEWVVEAGYAPGKRKPTLEEIEMCKSPEGFNQINHCKALGLIPREDGTKAVSKKYGGDA